ncbi:MAG: hypothetical protein JNK12_01270 [Acidimicrobiales bacterium]|nr:hypothetical protein [Acidimicrobiales bacterium]
MTEPAPAEGDDGPGRRPVDPIPLPPDPMAPWLATTAATADAEDEPDRAPGERA